MTSLGFKILEQGPCLTLYGLVDVGGVCESEEFLAGLVSPAQVQFKARFERLTQVGFLRSPKEMRHLEVDGEPPVHEIKISHGPGYRLYVVRSGVHWVATHGGKKPKPSKVAAEVKRAREKIEAARL